MTLINKKTKKRGWEYLKIWVGIFQVGIFWVGIFRGELTRGEFDWREFSGWEFSWYQLIHIIIYCKLVKWHVVIVFKREKYIRHKELKKGIKLCISLESLICVASVLILLFCLGLTTLNCRWYWFASLTFSSKYFTWPLFKAKNYTTHLHRRSYWTFNL